MVRFGDPNPAITRHQRHFMESLFHDCVLPRRIQELIRLRIAFHNQCRSCMAMRYEDALKDGVTEDLVCSLERPEEAKDLSDADPRRSPIRRSVCHKSSRHRRPVNRGATATLQRAGDLRDQHQLRDLRRIRSTGGDLNRHRLSPRGVSPRVRGADNTLGRTRDTGGPLLTVGIRNGRLREEVGPPATVSA